jgi:hypothetical protein
VQALLALAKALDPTGKALPKWRADNTRNWCKKWLAQAGCDAETGRLSWLDVSQAGLRAAAPLQGTLPQQLPRLPGGAMLQLSISGIGIRGSLPPWVLQIAYNLEVTNTSITGPLPSIPATPLPELGVLLITGNRKLSGTLPASWSNVPH